MLRSKEIGLEGASTRAIYVMVSFQVGDMFGVG